MLVFGVVGYLFKKLDYPLAPLVLALVLGDKAEDSFRQSMLLSQGEVSHLLVQRPGRQHHDAGAAAAVLAADLAGASPIRARQERQRPAETAAGVTTWP